MMNSAQQRLGIDVDLKLGLLHERTESNRYEKPNFNQFNVKHKEEEENVNEFIDKEDDLNNVNEENKEELDDDQHNVSQESGFKQEEDDAYVTLTVVHDTQKTEGPMKSSFVSFDFIEKLLNFENVSPTDNEIASLMDTIVCHEDPSGQTYTLFTVPITTIPPPPHFFNPLPQQTTPTPTPTISEATTSFPTLLDFSSVLKFNDKVTKLETDLEEMKQVDQYAQAISFIPAIVDRYINNKLREAIHKVTQSHNAECREEAQVEKQEYIDLVDLSTSQPKSTYEAATSLSEYELTKILLDKMVESKPPLRADYKRELYDALIKSYNTDKYLFETYGEVFTLKRSRDEKDKRIKNPSAEGKSSSSSKDTSRSHHKSSGKFAHVEELSHTVDDSGVQKNQEFDKGNNDEKPNDEAAPKNDWFKKPERPPTPDPDWNKRQQVDF
ncbi:hypothetical protein Tco_1057215 [Tanacetum coccineum]|uniref:Uncharacterized protein n=1 Tax=Tanacetum coccineum TaxID=301880 RepID=A0ABQ5H4T2_9ASTR